VTSIPAVGKPVADDAKTAAGANNKAEIAVRTRQPALVERAYAALTAGQWEEARGLYEAALGGNAQDRDALLGLAYLAARGGRVQEASSFYQEVLRFDPSNHSAQAGLMSLEANSSAEPSANRARELAQRQPESANALAAAAAAMVREGQLAEAEQLYGRARALEPLVGAYAFNHAVALDRLGQYARALPQYEAALRLAERPGSGVPVETVRQRVAVLRQALEGAAGK
jgi:tetratricopeptide (TPR) repeat protein